MPDLRPDTSIYPHTNPNSGPLGGMSMLDLIKTAQGIQEYQSNQSMTNALQGATDPNTGQVDWDKVGQVFQGSPGFKTPQQFQAVTSAGEAQAGFNQSRTAMGAQILSPLLSLGKNITRADVAAVAPSLVKVLGTNQAGKVAQLLNLPDGAPLANALLNLKQGFVGATAPSVTIPGVGGGPSSTVSPAQSERMGTLGGGTQAPGVPSTAEPPELQAERGAAQTFQERVTPLVNAIASARKLGPDATGPLSDELNTFKKAAGTLGIKGIDWDKVNSYDSLKKALTQWSDNLSTGGTNDRLAQAIAGNPNLSMRNATIQTLAKVAYSQEARRQAIYSEFANSGLPNSAFPAYKAAMNQAWDPRAFTMPMMSKDARSKMLAGMTGTEREKFKQSLNVARKYVSTPPEGGWYTPADEQPR